MEEMSNARFLLGWPAQYSSSSGEEQQTIGFPVSQCLFFEKCNARWKQVLVCWAQRKGIMWWSAKKLSEIQKKCGSDGCVQKQKIKCVTWNSHRIFQSLWTWLWVRAYMAGPERWWTIPGYSEVMGNCDGGWYQYWRANRLSELGIGAKDSSNYLVAGFLRSFPQDRRSHGAKKKERAKFCDVEQRMRGLDGKFYISQPILKLRRCKD